MHAVKSAGKLHIAMQLAHRPLTCSFCKIETSWYAILQHAQVSDGVFNYSIVVFASTDKGMSEAIIVQTLEHRKWLRCLSLSLSLSPSDIVVSHIREG